MQLLGPRLYKKNIRKKIHNLVLFPEQNLLGARSVSEHTKKADAKVEDQSGSQIGSSRMRPSIMYTTQLMPLALSISNLIPHFIIALTMHQLLTQVPEIGESKVMLMMQKKSYIHQKILDNYPHSWDQLTIWIQNKPISK